MRLLNVVETTNLQRNSKQMDDSEFFLSFLFSFQKCCLCYEIKRITERIIDNREEKKQYRIENESIGSNSSMYYY